MPVLWSVIFRSCAAALMPSVEATAARWKAFLDNIEARQNELLESAEQALPQLVDLSQFELGPFSAALLAIRTQCLELIHKIEKTWRDQVSTAFEESLVGATDATRRLDDERRKGADRGFELELSLRRAEVEIAAAAAERIIARATEILAAGFKCTRCGAPLTVKQFLRSHYVPCEFCRTVNTFEPGNIARQVEYFSVHALAERAALDAHVRFMETDHRYRTAERSATAVTREELVERYSAYVDTYLAERIRWLPALEKDVAEDRRSRIEAFIYGIA